jgi:hypothetical protein
MYAPQVLDLRGDRGGNKDKQKKKPKKEKLDKGLQRREPSVPASNITRSGGGSGSSGGEK